MPTKRCPVTCVLGDDFGDNPCTLQCNLDEGHEGVHREESNVFPCWRLVATWEVMEGMENQEKKE